MGLEARDNFRQPDFEASVDQSARDTNIIGWVEMFRQRIRNMPPEDYRRLVRYMGDTHSADGQWPASGGE